MIEMILVVPPAFVATGNGAIAGVVGEATGLFDFDRVLGALSARFFLAIATNRGRSLERLFDHFGLDRWFHFRISTVDAEPKPHPEMLLKCIARFGVSKPEALYLGDSVSDRDAASNAGIDYLWVGGTEEPRIDSVMELAHF